MLNNPSVKSFLIKKMFLKGNEVFKKLYNARFSSFDFTDEETFQALNYTLDDKTFVEFKREFEMYFAKNNKFSLIASLISNGITQSFKDKYFSFYISSRDIEVAERNLRLIINK